MKTLNKKNSVLLLALFLLIGVNLAIFINSVDKLNSINEIPNREVKLQELAIKDFQEWKKNFNLTTQKTYLECFKTEDTFKKLYCNIEYSKATNQTIMFP